MKHTLRCHGFGDPGPAAWSIPATGTRRAGSRGQNRASPRGLRPESPLALSLGLPIQRVLAAPRFALATILTHNARAFHRVTGSTGRCGPVAGARTAQAVTWRRNRPPVPQFLARSASAVTLFALMQATAKTRWNEVIACRAAAGAR